MNYLADLMRLPEEMRTRRQWCVAGPDGKGTFKAPFQVGANHMASVTDPSHWSDFDAVIQSAHQLQQQHGQPYGVGYVIAEDDPFTIIDLDVKEDTPQDKLQRYWMIAQTLDSYTERSVSGKGLHIICRGAIGLGCRRDGAEMYSQERFMVCTGNVVLDRPVQEAQHWLNILASEMRGPDTSAELAEVESELTDLEIVEKLAGAINGDKFTELCKGDWTAMGYPSQSEADLALMSMFCFHSRSNEQCRNLFRMTALGKRNKATRDNVYLNRTLKIVRGRQEREHNVETHGAAVAAALIASATPIPVPPAAAAVEGPGVVAGEELREESPMPAPVGELDWPPGMLGAVAAYIYQCAPRPVKEVAIIAALGLIAGIAGRTYQLPQSGLNVYLVLVARSAVGKEAMHSGIARIVQELMGGVPGVINFVSYADFASGPALAKAVAENQCFVNVSAEFGRKLKRLAQEDGRDGPMAQLRTVMTNLYQKSSIESIVGGLGYSDKEKSVASVSGVAYSMIGETTPTTFYESLTESMMEDGFLSRFTIIEYAGDRPPIQMTHPPLMQEQLKTALSQLVASAEANQVIWLNRTDEAALILHNFNLECDKQINSTVDEAWRQMWNRAHLKVLRIAGLLAVADNHVHPVIHPHHVQWALDLIRRDIGVMARRIAGGDVGTGDAPRERKLLSLVDAYMRNPVSSSYNIPPAMHKAGIISRSYFQIRVQRIGSFTGHRMGATKAMDDAIRSLVDSGYLQEVGRDKLVEQYGFHGKAYRIVTAPHMPHH